MFPGAAWQRCIVHLERNAAACCPTRRKRAAVLSILGAVFSEDDPALVRELYGLACEEVAGICPKAAELLEDAEPDALAYLDFPPSHWKRLRTNNLQERTNREIKRRSRVVQVFPSVASLVRLAGAVMCEQDEAWSASRYFSEARMRELYSEAGARPAAPLAGAELEGFARRAIESSLELADRLEAA